jgi:hypothetical protein
MGGREFDKITVIYKKTTSSENTENITYAQ